MCCSPSSWLVQEYHERTAARREISVGLTLNLNAQKMVLLTEVLHSELALQGSNDGLQQSGRGVSEHDVVDVQQQICHIGATTVDEHGRVGFGQQTPRSEGGRQSGCTKRMEPA